jgi:hypothetical protein
LNRSLGVPRGLYQSVMMLPPNPANKNVVATTTAEPTLFRVKSHPHV